MKIISQETIKPSSPTPPHLKTHILTLADIYAIHIPVPFVLFYKNYKDGDINILKKSLSQCLTQYYPIAGRISSPSSDHIDCNDEGIEFFEASHDSHRLDDFICKEANHKSLRELLPNVNITSLAAIQLNHFTCGGVAIAICISHKVADGFAIATFINQWANVTRGGTMFKPKFMTSSTSHNNIVDPRKVSNNNNGPKSPHEEEVKCTIKSFVFPNSKLNDLKKRIMSSTSIDVTTPPLTRVEVLTSLIVKHILDAAAAATKSGLFKPLCFTHAINMRNKIINNDPEKVAGNIGFAVVAKVVNPRENALDEIVDKLRKAKMEAEQVRDMQHLAEKISNMLGDDSLESIWTTSFCWFGLYDVDFGWGVPVLVEHVMPDVQSRIICLMDTPYKDGIEATLKLPEEEMVIFQQDRELLAFVDT